MLLQTQAESPSTLCLKLLCWDFILLCRGQCWGNAVSLSKVLMVELSAKQELSKVFEEFHADCNVCCQWEALRLCQILLTYYWDLICDCLLRYTNSGSLIPRWDVDNNVSVYLAMWSWWVLWALHVLLLLLRLSKLFVLAKFIPTLADCLYFKQCVLDFIQRVCLNSHTYILASCIFSLHLGHSQHCVLNCVLFLI